MPLRLLGKCWKRLLIVKYKSRNEFRCSSDESEIVASTICARKIKLLKVEAKNVEPASGDGARSLVAYRDQDEVGNEMLWQRSLVALVLAASDEL